MFNRVPRGRKIDVLALLKCELPESAFVESTDGVRVNMEGVSDETWRGIIGTVKIYAGDV
jgi:hypothetical protein